MNDSLHQLSDSELESLIQARTAELRETLVALKESERQFREFAEGTVLGICMHKGWTPHFVNQAYCDIFGYGSPQALLDLGTIEYLFPEDERARLAGFREARLRGDEAPSIYEVRCLRKDGTEVWTENAVRLVELNGETLVHCIVRDITERKHLERNLTGALAEANEANRAKQEFLASVSHELRTPLNAIIGFSDILCRELYGPLGDDRYDEYATHIKNSGEHLLELINDILDISRIEAGKFELYPVPTAPGELVCDTVAMLREQCENAGVELTTHITPDLPSLNLDQRAIRQIVLNLLSNAIKFTPAGGRIQVRCESAEDGGVEVAIQDTGIGIAEEDLQTVLSPFARGRDVQIEEMSGTGLGLAISNALAALHGGTLVIKSELGTGTTVTVHLPVDRHAS